MTLVDGKALAEDISAKIKTEIEEKKLSPKMVVIACNPNFETKKYLALKQSKADTLGIILETIILPEESSTENVLEIIKEETDKVDGIIVQLPLPKHIDTALVLKSIPKELDVDAFNYEGEDTTVLPPVIGAIDEISKQHQISWQDKQVVIFGFGRLVGAPAEKYAKSKKSNVTVMTEVNTDLSLVKKADIIVLGVGKPSLLTSEMVKPNVVVFDAGASEDGGLLVGDADPGIATLASLFTPVPGGIGPITIALLFKNLLGLKKRGGINN